MAAEDKFKAAIAVAVNQSTGPEVTKADATLAAAKTLETMKSDPVLVNAMGQERWWQSGVGVFGTGGVLWSIGWLFTAIATNGTDLAKYDMNTAIMAIGSLAGFGGVLYRRYAPGLKPLFWRWGEG